MNKEKVSIIIPIYNGAKYLKRCLDSVLTQTYDNIEVICVNDGSKDNTLTILKEYCSKDNRVIIIDKSNEGVSSARNDAINMSTGNYITFVDADDWLEKDAIDILYSTMLEKNVDVVRANYYRNFKEDINDSIGEKCDVAGSVVKKTDEEAYKEIIDEFLSGKLNCFIWLLLIKREYVLQTLLFKTDLQLMEDMIFYIELLTKINSIYFLDIPTYHYYCNENSCTRSKEYYERNIYNIIRVNGYIKDILSASKLNDNERQTMIDTTHLNMICNLIYLMYRTDSNNNLNIKNEVMKLNEDEKFKNIAINANLNLLPIYLKKSASLIINKQYDKLFLFYNFRIIMSKLKDVIRKRKE